MPTASRGSLYAALVQSQWVCLFQKEDPYGDPVFFFHHINVHLEADPVNTANVKYIVQESEDGTTWFTILEPVAPLVPGGFVEFSYRHVRRYVRVLVYSTGTGGVNGTLLTPEAQVVPQLLENVCLACASMCEQSCETGTETVG